MTVEGESGIGKTALVKRGLASAGGFRALSARSGPVRDRPRVRRHRATASQCRRPAARPVPAVPGGRREVLSVRGSRGTVGRAGRTAGHGPIAMVVDDVQWADRPSVDALSFMLRRLSVEPVLVLLVIRGDHDHPGHPAHAARGGPTSAPDTGGFGPRRHCPRWQQLSAPRRCRRMRSSASMTVPRATLCTSGPS